MYERRPPLKLWPVHTQYSNLSNGKSRWWHHVLHIMLNNDGRQRTDSTDTQRHKEPGERVQSICMKRDTCTGPQHCSKPAISERARDSTAQSTNTSQHNISSLYVTLCMCAHRFYTAQSIKKRLIIRGFTHNAERSRDTRPCSGSSRGTCGSF